MLSWFRRAGNDQIPGRFADLHRFDDFLRLDVDHRHVVGDAVGRQQIFPVRGEGRVPDALADQQIFAAPAASSRPPPRCGWPVRATRRPACRRAVMLIPTGWMFSARRPGTSNLTRSLILKLAASMIDDVAADFRRNPDFRAVGREGGHARARVHQHIGQHLAFLGVDEMRHAGGLGGGDHDLAVRAYRHALRLDADAHRAERSCARHSMKVRKLLSSLVT